MRNLGPEQRRVYRMFAAALSIGDVETRYLVLRLGSDVQPPLAQSEIGEVLGMCQASVSRLEAQVMAKLRRTWLAS